METPLCLLLLWRAVQQPALPQGFRLNTHTARTEDVSVFIYIQYCICTCECVYLCYIIYMCVPVCMCICVPEYHSRNTKKTVFVTHTAPCGHYRSQSPPVHHPSVLSQTDQLHVLLGRGTVPGNCPSSEIHHLASLETSSSLLPCLDLSFSLPLHFLPLFLPPSKHFLSLPP